MSKAIYVPTWIVYLVFAAALIDFTAGLMIGVKIGFAKGQQVQAAKR